MNSPSHYQRRQLLDTSQEYKTKMSAESVFYVTPYQFSSEAINSVISKKIQASAYISGSDEE
jgi:hypothetical protein